MYGVPTGQAGTLCIAPRNIPYPGAVCAVCAVLCVVCGQLYGVYVCPRSRALVCTSVRVLRTSTYVSACPLTHLYSVQTHHTSHTCSISICYPSRRRRAGWIPGRAAA